MGRRRDWGGNGTEPRERSRLRSSSISPQERSMWLTNFEADLQSSMLVIS
jgi:hypothetical protein